MTRAIAQTYSVASDYMVQITATILGLCAFMALLYGVNIYRTISATIDLQKAETQVASLSSVVGALDSKYMNISRSTTPDSLKTYGLTQGKVSAFISSPASLSRVASSGHGL